jgi:Na+-transporting NADH:ubiquinone oxidoreductase subunit NqrC
MKIKKKNSYIQILYLSIIISFVTSILFLSSYGLSFAQKDDDEDEEDEEDKLVVKAQVNLENIDLENTKFIRVIGFINGEEVKEDIPISSIDKADDNLDVELKVNEENDIVEADTPDEFFVCGYQVGDVSKESTTTHTKI